MAKPPTNGSGQIQRSESRPPPTGASLAALVQRMGPELQRAVPKHVDPERIARIALTALRTVPKLAECSAPSFMGSLMQSAQLGLEPSTPMQHCWLIPRKNGEVQECTLQIGYQGMIELAMRSGKVSGIFAHAVREGDDFLVTLGLNPDIRHVPSTDDNREARKITYVYAVARMKDGGDPIFSCLSRAQVESRRARSDGYKFAIRYNKKTNPWQTDEEAMFKKTAVRDLFKWLPKSAEMARAVVVDEALERVDVRQSAAFDPEISEALRKEGFEEPPIDTDGEPVDDGEMTEDERRAVEEAESAEAAAEAANG